LGCVLYLEGIWAAALWRKDSEVNFWGELYEKQAVQREFCVLTLRIEESHGKPLVVAMRYDIYQK
jgi:hypothetical protein